MRTLVGVVLLAAIAAANPVMVWWFSEIQVAPDSLQRIEIHPSDGYGEDLSGWQIQTRAGVAVIDQGVTVPAEGYVTIDSTNTSGVFDLNDSADTVRLLAPQGYDVDIIEYPAFNAHGNGACWTPPPNMSCATFFWEVWNPEPETYMCWYFDSTPTFGEPDGDTLSGICGYVRDQYSQPVRYAPVSFAGPYGTITTLTTNYGYYSFHPTGPSTFHVSATCPGYQPGSYPESVHVGVNQWVDGINIVLYSVGVAEDDVGNPPRLRVAFRGRTLVLTADRPGRALVTVCDNLGRVRLRQTVFVNSGRSEVSLRQMPGGIYFASCRFGESTSIRKIVLH